MLDHKNQPSIEPGPFNGYEPALPDPVVFVVDPDAATRNAVRDLVGMMGLQCQTYVSGGQFMEAYADSVPGCIILELNLAGMAGIQIQRRLKSRGDETPVIFLTAHPELTIAVEAIRAGAVHFLQKPFRGNELWNTIQEAIETDQWRRCRRKRRERLAQRLDGLTRKEIEVLTLIGRGKGNRQIAADMKIGVRTVETHRARLARKIGASSLRELVEVGISLVADSLCLCEGGARQAAPAAWRRGLPR